MLSTLPMTYTLVQQSSPPNSISTGPAGFPVIYEFNDKTFVLNIHN